MADKEAQATEKAFVDFIEMFETAGWKKFVDTVKENVLQGESFARVSINTEVELGRWQGKDTAWRGIIDFEKNVRGAYENFMHPQPEDEELPE